ncbi:hypothetical protein GCM10022205_21020 [Spinactinospora alkalitolerans]
MLVNVAVFGIAGAVMMGALIGLLLVFSERTIGVGVQILFGAMSAVILVALPAMAAAGTFDAGAGFGQAFLAAFCVVTVVYAANIALLPLVAQRAAARRGAGPTRLRLSPTTLAGGLVVCAVLGLIGAALGTVLS